MPIVNGTHIMPAVYTQKTSAIRSSGAALMLDNSALDAVDDICTTDVIQRLAEIEKQAYDLTVQHNAHFSEDLSTFLNLIKESMEVTDTTIAGSLQSREPVFT